MADKKLNEVTANATVDYVIGTLNDGSTVRISRADLRKLVLNTKNMNLLRASGVKWIRIAKSYNASNVGNSFIIMVNSMFNNSPNESYIFAVCVTYSKLYVTQLAGGSCTNSQKSIGKVRATCNSSETAYFDIYLNKTYSNDYYWTVIGAGESLDGSESDPTAGTNTTELSTTDMS